MQHSHKAHFVSHNETSAFNSNETSAQPITLFAVIPAPVFVLLCMSLITVALLIDTGQENYQLQRPFLRLQHFKTVDGATYQAPLN